MIRIHAGHPEQLSHGVVGAVVEVRETSADLVDPSLATQGPLGVDLRPVGLEADESSECLVPRVDGPESRVVTAGVPRRMPDGVAAFAVSKGTVLALHTRPARSSSSANQGLVFPAALRR